MTSRSSLPRRFFRLVAALVALSAMGGVAVAQSPACSAWRSELASLQGQQRTWFCGSYFGYGFHEDALEAGLWVGEALSGVARPWTLEQPSSRTGLPALPVPA